MPEDTHEDIRRRLFEAAWEAPTFAPMPRRTIVRARRRAAFTIFGGAAAVVAAVAAIILTVGGVPLAEADKTGRDVPDDDPREYLVDVDTGEQTVYGTLPSGAWLYDISRDGSRVAFVAEAEGRNQVWIMNLDGSELRQLTHDPFEATDPAWSPDGSKIVYVGFGNGLSRELFVVDVATGDSARVMSEPEDPQNPGWSPDASRILYWSWIEIDDPLQVSVTTTTLEVRSVEIATRRVTVLAGGGLKNMAWDGAWSRSGRIAYMGGVLTAMDDRIRLLLMDGDGSRKESQLTMVVNDAIAPSWSPDETRIAYLRTEEGAFYVHVLDLATGEDGRILAGEYAKWVDDDTLLVQETLPDHV
jgi:Tol biopolymer transport system component